MNFHSTSLCLRCDTNIALMRKKAIGINADVEKR